MGAKALFAEPRSSHNDTNQTEGALILQQLLLSFPFEVVGQFFEVVLSNVAQKLAAPFVT
jgi:hypothetical protein